MGNWQNNWVDYYEILGVERNASNNTIKKKYRKLMAKYHPDSYKGEAGDEKAKLINEAYSVLSNEEEKKLYDEFWDFKQNSNNNTHENNYQEHNEYQQNDTYQDINYEDIQNSYTEQEILCAKRMSLKKIIEESLEKIKLILDAKNEIILSAYFGYVEKREYRDNVKELMQIVSGFIEEIRQLASKAYELDMPEDEENLMNLIVQIEQDVNDIPTNVSDAYFYAQKELFKENLKIKVDEEILNATNIMNELNLFYINICNGYILELDYERFILEWKYKAEDCSLKLQQFLKLELEFDLKDEKCLQEKICELNSSILTIPKNYDQTVMIGKIMLSIYEIRNTIDDWDICSAKITKIMKILQRYPNSYRYPFLYNYGVELLKKQLDDMKTIKKNSKKISTDIINDSKVLELVKEAVQLYEKANDLHKKADEIYSTKEVEQILGEDVMTIAEDSYALWDKQKALEILVEAKKLGRMIEKIETPFVKELDMVRKELKKLIKNADKFNEDFLEKYKWTNLNPYAYWEESDYLEYIKHLENELLKEKLRKLGFSAIIGILIFTFLCDDSELNRSLIYLGLGFMGCTMLVSFSSTDLSTKDILKEKEKTLQLLQKHQMKKVRKEAIK